MLPDHHPDPGQDDEGDELAALLCMALDGAAADPVRLSLLTRLALFLHEPDREPDRETDLEPDRETDLERLREAGIGPVVTL